MPGKSGPELAAILTDRWPRLRVLYVSGYNDLPFEIAGESRVHFLARPFTPEALAVQARRALE